MPKTFTEGQIKISTLADNTGQGCGILGEHGFSALVETPEMTLLVDTGASGHTVAHNACNSGFDLSSVDAIVLSHGHWDHTGGLESVLMAVNKKDLPIYAHPAIWERKGVVNNDGSFSYAGIQFCRSHLERLGARFLLDPKPRRISDNILLTGEEEMSTDFECVDKNLAIQLDDGSVSPDPMSDDQSLILKTERGLVLVLGCAHRGLINIIRYAQKLTSEQRVYMVIGGTHLAPASDEQLRKTIEALREIGVKRIGVSHCTGQRQAAVLCGEFKDSFFFNNAGNSITI